MLGTLEESFNSLESGSKNMLAQVKLFYWMSIGCLELTGFEGQVFGGETNRETLVPIFIRVNCL